MKHLKILTHNGPYRKVMFPPPAFLPCAYCRVLLRVQSPWCMWTWLLNNLKSAIKYGAWFRPLIWFDVEHREPEWRCPSGSVVGCLVFLFVHTFWQLVDSPASGRPSLAVWQVCCPTCWNFLLILSWRPSTLAGMSLLRLFSAEAAAPHIDTNVGSTGGDGKPIWAPAIFFSPTARACPEAS